MIRALWKRFFAKPESTQEMGEIPAGPAATPWHTFGEAVVFTNREKNITRTIVDDKGRICDFPGIDPEVPACCVKKEPRIHYRTDFERRADGKILMIWEVQPDGRYWADEDGFGMTNDEEIRLYSVIDEEGRFLHPFKLYNRGIKYYYDMPG